MPELTIKTNNQYRPVISGFELSERERAEFGYYSSLDALFDASFFRYRGRVYDLCEFTRVNRDEIQLARENDEFAEYDGYIADSFFSGVLVKYSDNFESVRVATYYW